MTTYTIMMIVTAVIFLFLYRGVLEKDAYKVKVKGAQNETRFYFYCLMALALVVRIVAALSNYGHETDMSCFFAWSGMVYEGGFANFYQGAEYPPGYMYILYVIGWIRDWAVLDNSGFGLLLIKLPAILCDLALGWIVYKVASKKFSDWGAILVAALFLFNPLVILDSSTWGQVDSVFTLFVVATIYLLTQHRRIPAYFVFAVGVLMKPQTLIFTPVLICAIIDQVFLHDFSIKKFWTDLLSGLAAIGTMFLCSIPYGIPKVWNVYTESLAESTQYATVNAYNFWGLMGKNWVSQEETFLSITYNEWGTCFLVLAVAASVFLFFKAKDDDSKYYFSGAVIITVMFFLSVRMHERYIYPVVPLLLLAYAARPRKEKFIAFTLFTISGFLNVAHVLFFYIAEEYDWHNPVIRVISFCTAASFVWTCYTAYKNYLTTQVDEKEVVAANRMSAGQKGNQQQDGFFGFLKKKGGKVAFQQSEPGTRIKRVDLLVMAIITLAYAFVAFYDLGDRKAPESEWKTEVMGDEVIIDLGEKQFVEDYRYFLGYNAGRNYQMAYSDSLDGGWTTFLKTDYLNDMEEADRTADPPVEPYMRMGSVFAWCDPIAFNQECRYIRFTSTSEMASIMEMAIRGREGKLIVPVNRSELGGLFDEQDLVPERRSFRNSTHFDEVYHARTAYEYIHGLYSYENTHPPLGKCFIALGILIFGMNPFGWRFMGTLFGVLMVPAIYVFAKKLFKETWLAAVVTLLFTFDFMHFAQTRISTIDVFVTLFVILMYYFMYLYSKLSFYDTPFKKTLVPLGLSGICMGLGVASKWTGVYAGVGLSIIFFLIMYRRYREYRYALSRKSGKSGEVAHSFVIENYHKYMKWTLAFCIVFFVCVPILIYTLSYLPFRDGTDKGLIGQMLGNQKTMFNYHSQLDAPLHTFSSKWYQWPIMQRPIWFHSAQVGEGVKEGISSFGNPLVWWAGIPAFLYMIWLYVKEKDRKALFLIIAYLAQYAPWLLVSRMTFIYHYFPSVPFVTLMLGYAMYRMYRYKPKLKYAIFGYAAAACVMFAMFYPVLSGMAVEVSYVQRYLKWFESWVLIARL